MKLIHECCELAIYQIRISGQLDPHWSGRLENLNVVPQRNGETILVGLVRDQATLHRLLDQVHELGLPLLSVSRIDRGLSVTK